MYGSLTSLEHWFQMAPSRFMVRFHYRGLSVEMVL